jgi:hypothetical protein
LLLQRGVELAFTLLLLFLDELGHTFLHDSSPLLVGEVLLVGLEQRGELGDESLQALLLRGWGSHGGVFARPRRAGIARSARNPRNPMSG